MALRKKKLIREGAFGKVYKTSKGHAVKETTIEFSASNKKQQLLQLRNDLLVSEVADIYCRSQTCPFFQLITKWELSYSPKRIQARLHSREADEDGLRLLRSTSNKDGAFLAMTMHVFAACEWLLKWGIVHRDLKANNVLVYRNGGPSTQSLTAFGCKVNIPSSMAHYRFVLIDFGSADSVSSSMLGMQRLEPHERSLRPAIENSDKKRRPEQFVFYNDGCKLRVASCMRFGGLMPVLGDGMQWFGSNVALLQEERIHLAMKGLAYLQYTEQRIYNLLKNERSPDCIEAPRVLREVFVVPSSLREQLTSMIRAGPQCSATETASKALSMALRYVLPVVCYSICCTTPAPSDTAKAVQEKRPGAYAFAELLTRFSMNERIFA